MNWNRPFSILLVLLILASLSVPLGSIVLAQGKGRAGTSLKANITASAVYYVEYSWTISKEASASRIDLTPHDPVAVVEYTVSVEKELEIESYYIEGYVCVDNVGDESTQSLTISLDIFTGPGWGTQIIDEYPVSVEEKPVLEPYESYCYSYRVYIPSEYWDYTKFKVIANVTILNHSGRLGTPFGPTPSYTTERTIVKMYDCVNVEDSAGYYWSTCEIASWMYSLVFEYDPELGEFYEYVNTATIVETGESSSWILEVYQEIMMYATISGVVFWDNNYDGVYNCGDKPIGGATVVLYMYDSEVGEWKHVYTVHTNEDGIYSFEVEPGYLYKVEVLQPECELCDMITMTTSSFYEIWVEEPVIYSGYDFGFVCLKKLVGAYSKGYWSWSQYNRRTGQWLTRVTFDDVDYINSQLGTNFRSPKELADYLISPVYGDMRTALMQQLIATLLNLKYEYISGETIIYYDGNYISICEAVSKAKDALREGSRADQEYWKDLLDAVNNNYVYYVYKIDC